MKKKSLLIFGLSLLINALWVTSAKASIFFFSRKYLNTEMTSYSLLKGHFAATDYDKNGIISADEVNLEHFKANVTNILGELELSLDSSEPLKIINHQFNYVIGKNHLIFHISTDRPQPDPPRDINNEFIVNFESYSDQFRKEDVFEVSFDPHQTGQVIEISNNGNQTSPKVSESNAKFALLILGVLGTGSICKNSLLVIRK